MGRSSHTGLLAAVLVLGCSPRASQTSPTAAASSEPRSEARCDANGAARAWIDAAATSVSNAIAACEHASVVAAVDSLDPTEAARNLQAYFCEDPDVAARHLEAAWVALDLALDSDLGRFDNALERARRARSELSAQTREHPGWKQARRQTSARCRGPQMLWSDRPQTSSADRERGHWIAIHHAARIRAYCQWRPSWEAPPRSLPVCESGTAAIERAIAYGVLEVLGERESEGRGHPNVVEAADALIEYGERRRVRGFAMAAPWELEEVAGEGNPRRVGPDVTSWPSRTFVRTENDGTRTARLIVRSVPPAPPDSPPSSLADVERDRGLTDVELEEVQDGTRRVLARRGRVRTGTARDSDGEEVALYVAALRSRWRVEVVGTSEPTSAEDTFAAFRAALASLTFYQPVISVATSVVAAGAGFEGVGIKQRHEAVAINDLRRLVFATVTEHRRDGRWPELVELTPREPPCSLPRGTDAAPVWEKLGFQPDPRSLFAYKLGPASAFDLDDPHTEYVVRAVGDQDCDGKTSLLEVALGSGDDGHARYAAGVYAENSLE